MTFETFHTSWHRTIQFFFRDLVHSKKTDFTARGFCMRNVIGVSMKYNITNRCFSVSWAVLIVKHISLGVIVIPRVQATAHLLLVPELILS